MNPDELLAEVVVALLRGAADSWATGRHHDAERLSAAAWRLADGAVFIDEIPLPRSKHSRPTNSQRKYGKPSKP